MKHCRKILFPFWAILFLFMAIQLSATDGGIFHSGDTLFIGHGTTPTINGILSPGEWDDAVIVVLVEPGGAPGDATLYLKHDTANLFAAFENSNANYWVWWILIDTQNDGGSAPQTDDYKLIGPGYMVENVGNGSDWVQVTPSGWTAVGDEFSSECSISYAKLGITPGVAKTVGIAFCYGGAMPWENVWPPDLDTWNDEVVPNAWGDIISDDDWGAAGVAEDGDLQNDVNIHLAPNPFSDRVVISFFLSDFDRVNLRIYDANGRLIRTLVYTQLKAGTYTVKWDRTDQEGRVVPDGVYFYRLQTGNEAVTRSMIFLK